MQALTLELSKVESTHTAPEQCHEQYREQYEARFANLASRWPNHVAWLPWYRDLLLISQHGLNSTDVEQIKFDFLSLVSSSEVFDELVSVVTSIKMMHVYFRMREKTVDYRPHRGAFSGM